MSRFFNLAVMQVRMGLELPGCPEIIRVQALQDCLNTFCKETEAWQEELTAIDLVDGQLAYNLIPEFDVHVQRLIWVRVNTEEGVTAGTDGTTLRREQYTLTPGDPDVLTLEDALEPVDDITSGLTVKAVFVPEFNTMDVAEWFANRWWDALRAGAMDICLRNPNKRWTNLDKANEYRMQFYKGIQEAKGEKRQNYKDGFVGMEA